jgi:hypothetical protein
MKNESVTQTIKQSIKQSIYPFIGLGLNIIEKDKRKRKE